MSLDSGHFSVKLWIIHKVTSSKNIIYCFCLDQAEGQNEMNDFPSNDFVLDFLTLDIYCRRI